MEIPSFLLIPAFITFVFLDIRCVKW
jgi:hypothetical protein